MARGRGRPFAGTLGFMLDPLGTAKRGTRKRRARAVWKRTLIVPGFGGLGRRLVKVRRRKGRR